MATGSNVLARNAMLQSILDWNPGAVGTTMLIGAYTTDVDTGLIEVATATYATPASSTMNITSNVVLNIGAGNTIAHLRIHKGSYPNDSYIYKKDITPEVFTLAGTITITSAEISIADA